MTYYTELELMQKSKGTGNTMGQIFPEPRKQPDLNDFFGNSRPQTISKIDSYHQNNLEYSHLIKGKSV